MTVISWFSDIRRADIDRVGGKGANLGELLAAGIPAPPGFVVTANTYERFLRDTGTDAMIRGALSRLSPDDPGGIREAAAEIQSQICAAQMLADIASSIDDAYSALGGGLVAVRSSATAEDLAQASFAGQQSTYLNVTGTSGVVRAVQECWASLFEERAMVYRRQTGFDHISVKIAVVVQQMIQSERSGVMFTLNPVTGDPDSMIIEAIVGLGEAAVSGMVTPDMYIVNKSSLGIQEREISHQEQQFVRDESLGSEEPNVWTTVPPDLARSQKLSDAEIQLLAELGLRIEAHYGCPQDIEWALAGGEFYILQARPITAAGP